MKVRGRMVLIAGAVVVIGLALMLGKPMLRWDEGARDRVASVTQENAGAVAARDGEMRVVEAAPEPPSEAVAPPVQQEPQVASPGDAGEPARTESASVDDKAAEPAPVAFRDERVLAPPRPAGPAATEPGLQEKPVAAVPLAAPSFQDPRALASPSPRQPSAAGPSAEPDRAVAPVLVDSRPLSRETPRLPERIAFQDGRSLSGRAFDGRPGGAGNTVSLQAAPLAFRDERALSPQPSAPTRAGALEPRDGAPRAAATERAGDTRLAAASLPGAAKSEATCPQAETLGEPLEAGAMRLTVVSLCRRGQEFAVVYGGAEQVRRLDAEGRASIVLDLFAGTSQPIGLRFADESRRSIPAQARDLDKVTKVAVIWSAPVDLDLHAFEYAARLGEPGHVWSGKSSTLIAARELTQAGQRGRGYLSAHAVAEGQGDKVEVYTFLHAGGQKSGSIAFALDHATRGESPSGAACGAGALARVAYRIVVAAPDGKVTAEDGVLAPIDCGTRLWPATRFNTSLLPMLRVRQ